MTEDLDKQIAELNERVAELSEQVVLLSTRNQICEQTIAALTRSNIDLNTRYAIATQAKSK